MLPKNGLGNNSIYVCIRAAYKYSSPVERKMVQTGIWYNKQVQTGTYNYRDWISLFLNVLFNNRAKSEYWVFDM